MVIQEINYNGESETLTSPTYTYSKVQNGNTFEQSQDIGYGYKYNFLEAGLPDNTIIRPPLTSTPAVFELKNPNQNIQGRVR